jgi:glycosyltransferase involved in cell wall biosynthesis
MNEWLDLVQEVVVVDSFSKDGTLEIIQSRLRHPRLRILSHPPGLYESWNHGIRQLSSKYCYISTVGDTITRDGLEQMAAAAEQLNCDVLMSKPEFCFPDGTKSDPIFWPVEDMIHSLQLASPRRISRWEFLAFAAAHGGTGLLGSSASNLYKTATLVAHPFPTEFGRIGDSFWALQNCCRARWGVTPGVFSTFVQHPRCSTQAEKENESRSAGADVVLWETLEGELRSGRINRATLRDINFFTLWEEMSAWLDYKRRFDHARRSTFPWIVNPQAWFLRVQRNIHARNLFRLKDEALADMQNRVVPQTSEAWAY